MKAIFKEDTHQYFDESGREYWSVSRVIEHFGYSQIDKLKAIHGEAHFSRLAAFGKEVHKLTEAEDKTILMNYNYDKVFDPYIQGWCNFRMEALQNGKFMAIEEPLISALWGIGGTPDRVIDCGKWIEIADIKTGAETESEKLQTAIYQILVEENYKWPVRKRYSVHLDPKKKIGYYIVPHNNKNEITVAKCMLTVLKDKRERGII